MLRPYAKANNLFRRYGSMDFSIMDYPDLY
jgi:hypothetical protein